MQSQRSLRAVSGRAVHRSVASRSAPAHGLAAAMVALAHRRRSCSHTAVLRPRRPWGPAVVSGRDGILFFFSVFRCLSTVQIVKLL